MRYVLRSLPWTFYVQAQEIELKRSQLPSGSVEEEQLMTDLTSFLRNPEQTKQSFEQKLLLANGNVIEVLAAPSPAFVNLTNAQPFVVVRVQDTNKRIVKSSVLYVTAEGKLNLFKGRTSPNYKESSFAEAITQLLEDKADSVEEASSRRYSRLFKARLGIAYFEDYLNKGSSMLTAFVQTMEQLKAIDPKGDIKASTLSEQLAVKYKLFKRITTGFTII